MWALLKGGNYKHGFISVSNLSQVYKCMIVTMFCCGERMQSLCTRIIVIHLNSYFNNKLLSMQLICSNSADSFFKTDALYYFHFSTWCFCMTFNQNWHPYLIVSWLQCFYRKFRQKKCSFSKNFARLWSNSDGFVIQRSSVFHRVEALLLEITVGWMINFATVYYCIQLAKVYSWPPPLLWCLSVCEIIVSMVSRFA